MKKINFKQPKYIFPAVIFVPLLGLTYLLLPDPLFGGRSEPAS